MALLHELPTFLIYLYNWNVSSASHPLIPRQSAKNWGYIAK